MSETADVYARLSAPFPERRDPRGNLYIQADDAIARLNEVYGVEGWNFRILNHGVDKEEGEVWVIGQLEFLVAPAAEDEQPYWSVVQQFGGHKLQRFSRGDNAGKALDLGNDLQGAATDALKKCAKMRGIGLHLKAGQQQNGAQQRGNQVQQQQQPAQALRCAECNDEIASVRLQDGTTWTAQKLAQEGRQRFGQALCRTCYTSRRAA